MTTANMSYLAKFNGKVEPQTRTQYPSLENLADGNYDLTILSATIKEIRSSGDHVLECECRVEQTNQTVPLSWWIETDEQLARALGDFGTLGYAVATWGKPGGVPFEKAIPEMVATLRGKRFKGTKKTSANKNKPEKPYHNLYVNSALPPADPNSLPDPTIRAQPNTPAPKADEMPF